MSRARDNANIGTQAGSGLDASDITTGVLPVGVTGGSGLNALSASNLSAGTVPDARFPATLPAASGANLTALPAANLSGTITSATQDAITRLGTVTSGNLSNSAIVYPAGHVIYVDTFTLAGGSSTTSASWFNTGLNITVPSATVALGSKIVVMWDHVCGIMPGSTYQRMDWRIIRYAVGNAVLDYKKYVGHDSPHASVIQVPISGSCVDTALSTGNHTYYLEVQRAADSSQEAASIYYSWYTGAIHTISVMVIK